MLKKSFTTLVISLFLTSAGITAVAHAATISNGAACAKASASTTVKVKGVSKTYICKINPAIEGATAKTWTLKTCISYWAAAQNSQSSITDQRNLVRVMSEPDKTTYSAQLDASQAELDKVKAAIVSNHCKKGL